MFDPEGVWTRLTSAAEAAILWALWRHGWSRALPAAPFQPCPSSRALSPFHSLSEPV